MALTGQEDTLLLVTRAERERANISEGKVWLLSAHTCVCVRQVAQNISRNKRRTARKSNPNEARRTRETECETALEYI